MCALCGLIGTETEWSGSMASSLPVRQQRFLRIAQANRVLSFFHVLSSPTGRREMVSDFGQLWPVAETLAGRPIDPLDSALLDWLSSSPQ